MGRHYEFDVEIDAVPQKEEWGRLVLYPKREQQLPFVRSHSRIDLYTVFATNAQFTLLYSARALLIVGYDFELQRKQLYYRHICISLQRIPTNEKIENRIPTYANTI